MTLSDKLQEFYFHLDPGRNLPPGFEIMNPFTNPYVRDLCTSFYNKYFSDNNKRSLLLGINPGRFGAGVTGITFTDPIRLEKECGIQNNYKKRLEISSVFIYDVIRSYGGPDRFYSKFLLSAVSPLGFMRKGKNVNYYDTRELLYKLKPFIVSTLKQQVAIAGSNERVFCLGEGRNYWYLNKLNMELDLFGEIISLPHPRWIMQYRFRNKRDYVKEYLRKLENV
ncbi:MAG: hypothetical protein AMS27_04475 [Bacteroides sp. SM23_62_1]|nr:MAG: hypothetical protein AMS27_04475 [Bacteroides sp. SM23_62_1]